MSWLSDIGAVASSVGDLMGSAGAGAAGLIGRAADAFPGVASGGGEAMGRWGGAADLVSGVAKIADGNWGGGLGDVVSGGAGIADTFDVFGKGTPVGAIIGGGAQAIGNVYEMTQHSDERMGGYWDNKFWGSAGDATIGALHAGIGSWCPLAEMYISAGELGLDAIGGAAGIAGDLVDGFGSLTGLYETDNEWGFGAGDVVGMALHGGHDLINGIGGMLGGGADVIGDAGSAIWSAVPSMPSIW